MDWPSKQYNIIYADPPWSYDNYGYAKTKTGTRAKRGVEKEYGTLDMNGILSLPVADITADDCYLFLWVTFPLLDEGLCTMAAWGFKYKTLGFNWIKTYPKSDKLFWGMGKYTRCNPELCLVGVKGKLARLSASVHSVVMSPVTRHSAKPPEIRDKIVELYGDLPRIELFARDRVLGWDCWGNEV